MAFDTPDTNSYFYNTRSELTKATDVIDAAYYNGYVFDGSRTLVKTATGIWAVVYNGENRPILWTQGTTSISMSYDRMGRRVTKNNQRFVNNGYLQIANIG